MIKQIYRIRKINIACSNIPTVKFKFNKNILIIFINLITACDCRGMDKISSIFNAKIYF